jgi:hypothetical protein
MPTGTRRVVLGMGQGYRDRGSDLLWHYGRGVRDLACDEVGGPHAKPANESPARQPGESQIFSRDVNARIINALH